MGYKTSLQLILASNMHDLLSEEILESGNRNNSPNYTILNKIASDGRQKLDLDSNLYIYLYKLRQQLLEEESLKGSITSGFIQGYSLYPTFSVTLFMEKQLLHLIGCCKKENTCLHIDATGTAFAQPPDSDKRPFYYSGVLQGDKIRPPVAVFEFITCGHSVGSISASLDIFVEALKTCTPNKWPIIHQAETDFSKAIIQSSCMAFNNMDLGVYLDYAFAEAENPDKPSRPLTIMHVCSSHVIKAAIMRIKIMTNDEEIQKLLRSAIGLLLHTIYLEDGKTLFWILVKVFDCPKKSDDHEEYLAKLKEVEPLQYLDLSKNVDNEEEKKEQEKTENGEEIEEIDEDIVDFEFDFNNTKREQSKFYQEFFHVHKDAMKSAEKNKGNEKNPYYVPAFITYFLYELLPYYSTWSGIQIMRFGLRRNSNATAESWNKIIKRFVFLGKMRPLIP